ncbi:MAG: formate--tetrahydrofolate ligase [Gaiellaceae bacterium]
MTTTMPSSLEIAQDATLRPILDVAADAGLLAEEVEPYGRYKAKVDLSAIERLADRPDAKLINVTAITPTPAGEGKTTTSVSLTQGLGVLGRKPVLCLREASLGPVFGVKGGAAGGGYAQVVPMEDLNLHFTGDLHAITAANNLLAALIDAHLHHGNAAGLDPLAISWRRCMDMNDRNLRSVITGLGGRAHGAPRETGFDITAASEIMGLVAVARDLADLRERLGRITVGQTFEGEPVTAEQIKAAGALSVVLKDAIKPNLVQTLEGQPAFVHCGPFANIAHGNNSLVADRVGLKLGEYLITESGFASDMGMEKFFDITCRIGDLRPNAVVLVASIKALKHHAGQPEGGLDAIETGAQNLARHIGIVNGFGLQAVVGVNKFPSDTQEELELARRLALESGAFAAEINTAFENGGAGATALAEAVVAAADEPSTFDFAYSLEAPIEEKIRLIATRVYGADGVELLPVAKKKAAEWDQSALGRLPICMAKTHLSLSHDPALKNAPTGFTVTVRDLRPYTGAGWIVALCGEMMTMPGLGRTPAAFAIDIDERGETIGLFEPFRVLRGTASEQSRRRSAPSAGRPLRPSVRAGARPGSAPECRRR